jgi:hypothetical protein
MGKAAATENEMQPQLLKSASYACRTICLAMRDCAEPERQLARLAADVKPESMPLRPTPQAAGSRQQAAGPWWEAWTNSLRASGR